MTQQKEILQAIRECARKLGRNPSLRELRRMSGVKETELYRAFGNLARALRAAGLEPRGSGFAIAPGELLLDWAAVARKLGKLPTIVSYTAAGRFSQRPFLARYGHWSQIPHEFRKLVKEQKSEAEWGDVLALSARSGSCQKPKRSSKLQSDDAPRPRKHRKSFLLRDRPVYGRPLVSLLPALAHEPVNEAGVVFVFALLAENMGFVVQRLQTDFPDCEAMREMERGCWQRVRIEFEFESRNFLKHGHHGHGCDLIVCWIHNWPECPPALEVIELSRELNRKGCD